MKRIVLAVALIGAFSSAAGAADSKKTKKNAEPMAIGTSTESEFEQFDAEYGKQKQEALRVSDPLHGFNRTMFWFNDKFYFYLIKPIAVGYGFILPEPARTAVNRAYVNSLSAIRIVNTAFQGRFKTSGRQLSRFVINSTLGVGGLLDPADKWLHIQPVDADFGQTFGRYGVGHGWPIVLPIIGQTNVRDGIGMIPNFLGDPVYWLLPVGPYYGYTAGVKMNYASLHIGDYEKVKKDALDPYTFIRDAHLQHRDRMVAESKEDK